GASLASGGVAEEAGYVRPAFVVGLLGEVQVTAVVLALAGGGGLVVLVGLGSLQIRHADVLLLPGSVSWRRILDFGFAASSGFWPREAPEGAAPRFGRRAPSADHQSPPTGPSGASRSSGCRSPAWSSRTSRRSSCRRRSCGGCRSRWCCASRS